VQCWHPFAATHSTQAADTSKQVFVMPPAWYCSLKCVVLAVSNYDHAT
jgi:hypothetical protein